MTPFSQKVQAELRVQGLWHGGHVRGLVLTGAMLATLAVAAPASALALRQAGPVQVLGANGHWTAARNAQVRTRAAGDGSTRIVARADGARAVRMAFAAAPGERFFGFGSRSNAVDQRGHEVENYVADGPYREEDRNYTRASVPPWATRDRDDATYFPVPWLLSSRGVGTLIENDETSTFRLGIDSRDSWSAQVDGAVLRLRVFEGPTPARALARFTAATGRQPRPSAPWIFGPWFQTGQPNVVPLEEEERITRTLRNADAPVSAAETQMHYLPCGAHRGNEDYLHRRDAFFHAQGLAHLAYFNPALCASYRPVFQQASEAGVLQRGVLG
jgi:alpha-glucosidase (family GH31 glycosyl hydrolase)